MPGRVVEGLETIPPAVLAGLALGAAFAAVAAILFVLGERWFPTRRASEPRYSGEGRRRREIREYLGEIGERYAEDHPIAGHPVAFYLPERDVAITFDAHAFFRLRNTTGTAVVLVEHEMPVAHLGARLPFETPDPSPEPARSAFAERVGNAYGTLGLPTTASSGEVRSAYRERVKEVHPDHGGDEAAFRELREAYATARDHADGRGGD
ncbi:J domain-containing protein [Saliphagus infecundisoli]|uniref:J domain-containing protein n=1 Tax=Saliphagus infecundisoli TaxID=1849069 RepID=A0ABD5QKI0_9EURY|nr:J domain-containing protein [Saliphagus infecundisoli]